MMRAALLAGLAPALAGCATHRPDHFWYANSTPDGAVLTTDIGLTCVTPCRLEVPRWRGDLRAFNYTIEKPGFETVRGQAVIGANDTLAAGVALAILTTAAGAPMLPAPLDNKGVQEIEPNPLEVELVPAAPPAETAASEAP